MTGPISEGLSHCYSLLYIAEKELRANNCPIRALLCYENCRHIAEKNVRKEQVYSHCLLRASRKEGQLLRNMNLHNRAFRILKKIEKLTVDSPATMDKFLLYVQLNDLSDYFDSSENQYFFHKMRHVAELV
jgi:hypothetical protein